MKTQNTQLKPAGSRITSTSAGLLIRLNTYRAAVLALFFAGATLLSASAASADTITVINTNDSGPGSLRQALVDANDGDTINFDSSLNGQKITLTSGQLIVDKSVTISGPGANNLAVDGNAQSRVFYVNPGKTVTISGLTIANGHVSNDVGGGISIHAAALTVTNCVLSGNSAYSGGGIFNDSGIAGATLTVTNCTLSGNSGGVSGGGICNSGDNGSATLTITNSTLSGNSADYGGGIYNSAFNGSATLTITNSTLSGNSAGVSGGGIDSGAGGSNGGSSIVTVSNSTLSGNSAGVYGGGIYNGGGFNGGTTLTITNSTFSGNSATGNGGGIYNNGVQGFAGLELGSTILNAGSSGANISNNSGTVTSLGYNLSSDNGGGYLTGPGDQINTNPMLGPLQDNGGPTFTHALLAGSPAIDAGDPNFTPPPDYDQRGPGFDRVVNGRIDVGSFEIQSAPTPTPTPTVTPTPTATTTPTPTPRPSPTPRLRPTPAPRP